jgi:hypothetical protein
MAAARAHHSAASQQIGKLSGKWSAFKRVPWLQLFASYQHALAAAQDVVDGVGSR